MSPSTMKRAAASLAMRASTGTTWLARPRSLSRRCTMRLVSMQLSGVKTCRSARRTWGRRRRKRRSSGDGSVSMVFTRGPGAQRRGPRAPLEFAAEAVDFRVVAGFVPAVVSGVSVLDGGQDLALGHGKEAPPARFLLVQDGSQGLLEQAACRVQEFG